MNAIASLDMEELLRELLAREEAMCAGVAASAVVRIGVRIEFRRR